MRLGIAVYEGVNLLDVTGPYEMFNWISSDKGLETIIVSSDGGPGLLDGHQATTHWAFVGCLTR